MEDVDKVTVKFLHHHPQDLGFWAKPKVWGLGGGRGREAVFRTVFPPSGPFITGRCSAVSDFIGRCEGKFMEIPAKIQIKHLGNLERIHRQNLKFIDQADVRGVWILRAPGVGKIHFARQVLVAGVTTLRSTISGGMAIRARRSSSWRTLTGNGQVPSPPPQDLGFWAKPNGFGVWEGVGEGGRFRTSLPPLEQRPLQYYRRCS